MNSRLWSISDEGMPCGTDGSKQRPNLPNLGSHGPAQVHAPARPDLTHYHHGL